MRAALAIIKERAPDLEIDGEMHGDTALDSKLRHKLMPNSALKNDANLLVMPNIESANIAYSYISSHLEDYQADPRFFDEAFVHLHVKTKKPSARAGFGVVQKTALRLPSER